MATVCDDGSTVHIETEPDDPPKSGEWVSSEDIIASRTDEEEELGRRLGRMIDPDDDEDNGLGTTGDQW